MSALSHPWGSQEDAEREDAWERAPLTWPEPPIRTCPHGDGSEWCGAPCAFGCPPEGEEERRTLHGGHREGAW